MNEDKIRKALASYNANSVDRTTQETLQRQLGNYAVIARQPDGKVDVDETMENLTFALQTSETTIAGCITAEQLVAKPVPKIEADPVDGRPLRRGRTVTEPIVDWSHVPIERRRVVGFARLIGQLPHATAPCQSESVAADLQSASAAAPPPWPRILLKWEETVAAAAKGDKKARDQVEAVDSLLWFVKGATVVEPSPAVAATTSSPLMLSAQGSVIAASGQPSRAELRRMIDVCCVTDGDLEAFALDDFPAAKRQFTSGMTRLAKVNLLMQYATEEQLFSALRAAYPRRFAPTSLELFIVASDADKKAAEDLSRQCHNIKSRQTSFDCPAGNDPAAWLSSRMLSAQVVVVVLSAHMLSDEAAMSLVEKAAVSGRRVVPYVARACAWQLVHYLAGKKPLSADDYAASVEIRRLLGHT